MLLKSSVFTCQKPQGQVVLQLTVLKPKLRHLMVEWEKQQNDFRCDASLPSSSDKPAMSPVCVPVLSCTEDTLVLPRRPSR